VRLAEVGAGGEEEDEDVGDEVSFSCREVPRLVEPVVGFEAEGEGSAPSSEGEGEGGGGGAGRSPRGGGRGERCLALGYGSMLEIVE